MSRRNGRLARWFGRHPLIAVAIGIAVLGWMTFWEITRIAAARHTVAHGWAGGLAAGVTASLAMIALLTMALRMRKRTSGTGLGWVSALTLVITGSFIVAFRATAPPTVNVNHVPYVVTTGLAVAGMSYAAILAAACVAVIGWAAVRLIRNRAAGMAPRPTSHDTGEELGTRR